MQSKWKIMSAMLALVKPLWMWMVLAVLLGVAGFFCSILITVMGTYGLLSLLGLSAPLSLSVLFALLALSGIGRGLLRYGEQACNHYIAFRLLALIRDHVFTALRRLCPAKLEGKGKGDLISMLTSDVELLEVFYAHTISPVLIALIMSVSMSVLIGMWHPLLGVIALCSYAVVGIALPLRISSRCDDLGIRCRTQAGEFSSFMLESLRGLDETIQYGAGEARQAELHERSAQLSAQEGLLRVRSGEGMALTNTAILSLSLLMLAVSCFLYQAGALSLAGVVMSFVTLLSSFGPVTAIANLGTTLQNTLASGSRVLLLLHEEPEAAELQEGEEVDGAGAAFENVDFAYDEQQILSRFSLRIAPGKMSGICGKSGSGKSTMLRLMMRFWDVKGGTVRVGKGDVRHIRTASLRTHESFMTQQTHLFHDSILNNIRLVRPDASREEVEEACRKASIHEFIMSLPAGYDTEVGELGDTLSGGERQRIGLARVFLHDSALILLDEPTSNLDSLNEAVILKSLHEQKAKKTIVLVSHRHSSLRLCDEIIEVGQGRVS